MDTENNIEKTEIQVEGITISEIRINSPQVPVLFME